VRRTSRFSQRFLSIGLLVLYLPAGCSIHPIRTVVVNGNGLQERADIPLVKVNDGAPTAEQVGSTSWNYSGRIHEDIQRGNRCRVKYHPSHAQYKWVVVEGKIGNGRKYPVILDTGASSALFVNDTHIVENKLAISPSGGDDNASTGWGTCRLPELRIGELTLLNWSCLYLERHAEVQVFGFPVARSQAIIVGLPALQKFKYIVFDSVSKEAEFSLENAFEPENSGSWTRYSLVIEEGLGGNAYLFVKMPIAGRMTELQLDTGSGNGLAIGEELWQYLQNRIQNITLSQGTDLYPYIGWLACRRGVIPSLAVGERTVRNAKISVFPDDSPLLEGCQGLVGMQYFGDTIIVLDFERNLMWVKNP
jgi:hypothetical protein